MGEMLVEIMRTQKEKETVEMDAYPITPIDATGAGDCFDGTFICGLLESKSVKDAAKMAAASALNTAAFSPIEGGITPAAIQAIMKP